MSRRKEFQSTHPRGVRPSVRGTNAHIHEVSIHAPAWGATHQQHAIGCRFARFNPRTRVGCDLFFGSNILAMLRFQSTHPRGVRHLGGGKQTIQFSVSIHAPAWGATALKDAGWQISIRFNPRTRVGCDITGTDGELRETKFQSTHPRGVRHLRPHEDQVYQSVSIHAPAWGATTGGLHGHVPFHGFNPRTRVGCDFRCTCRASRACGFNPRTRVGCDILLLRTLPVVLGFNPRTRVGCDLRMGELVPISCMVSIHAPAWGATSRHCRR